jgi:hypothetical protein
MTADDSTRPGAALLAETLLLMLLASLLIRCMSFARLARLLSAERTDGAVASVAEIARLRRAAEAWGRRLPWRALCFEQGLTTHWLLQRRGLASTLFFGASPAGGSLLAHVWVRSGERDVIGCEELEKFAVLSRFPNGSSSSTVQP